MCLPLRDAPGKVNGTDGLPRRRREGQAPVRLRAAHGTVTRTRR